VCKKLIKNSQPFVKKLKMSGPLRGGFFLTHTVHNYSHHLVAVAVLRWSQGGLHRPPKSCPGPKSFFKYFSFYSNFA